MCLKYAEMFSFMEVSNVLPLKQFASIDSEQNSQLSEYPNNKENWS